MLIAMEGDLKALIQRPFQKGEAFINPARQNEQSRLHGELFAQRKESLHPIHGGWEVLLPAFLAEAKRVGELFDVETEERFFSH